MVQSFCQSQWNNTWLPSQRRPIEMNYLLICAHEHKYIDYFSVTISHSWDRAVQEELRAAAPPHWKESGEARQHLIIRWSEWHVFTVRVTARADCRDFSFQLWTEWKHIHCLPWKWMIPILSLLKTFRDLYFKSSICSSWSKELVGTCLYSEFGSLKYFVTSN